MGVHTGEPLVATTGYVGIDVHRAARIGAAAHGGQILLSERTRQAVGEDLGEEVYFSPVGTQRFKGLSEPIDVLQVTAPGLQTGFGPINTGALEEEPPAAGTAPYKGLLRFDERDAPLFFGRERVTDQIIALLQRERLLAVVGASGSGKSSIVRAGLIPHLKARTDERWRTYVLTPTADPVG
jgi:ABC-type multidrug transport system fused ATPase/permease subunit